MKTVAIYGGAAMDRQITALNRGAQVVVGTPAGCSTSSAAASCGSTRVRIVILDEADRMLDMGFIVDVETILARCPRQRQTALFSATMPYAILRICDRFMRRDAEHISVRPELRTVETTRQLVYFVAEQDKVAALVELADTFGFDRLLVFRHTQIGVDRLTTSLKRRGRNVAALHGGLSQRDRERTLAAFKAGDIQFLIATNVASRGLDIVDLPYVLSYDIPEDADTYIHRVGRTGRAGRTGTAITFVAEWDLDAWQAIQRRGRHGRRGRRAQPVPMTEPTTAPVEPAAILPQLAAEAKVGINSPHWSFEPYWIGDRLIARVGEGRVR